MTCEAEVALNDLTRTHQAWHAVLRPLTRVAKTNSASIHELWTFMRFNKRPGARRIAAKQNNPIAEVTRHETKKRLIASLLFFGQHNRLSIVQRDSCRNDAGHRS